MALKVVSPRTYFLIFAILIALTALTVGVSQLQLGQWHLAVGIAIGTVKAALVVLFFMHLYYSDWLLWFVAASGVLFLAILLVLTMNDYFTRTPV